MSRSAGDSSRRSGLPALIARRLLPPERGERADVWIQGVSVGEVELAHTLAVALRAERPALSLLATSSTPAGVELLGRRFRNLAPPARLQPFPLDLPVSVTASQILAEVRKRLRIADPRAALAWRVDELNALRGARAVLHVSGATTRLPREVELVFYRVAQEALTNAVRHGQAGRITLSLTRAPDESTRRSGQIIEVAC